MKLTYFYVTVEVVPRDGYSETLQCSVDRNNSNKLIFSFPYGEITPEQAAAVSEFTKTITAAYNKLQKQIDNVNQDLKLEQYAPIVPPVVETAGSDFDLDAESAVAQSLRGGSDTTDLVEHSEQEQEQMEELEARETGSDKA